jgi:DNA-binding CsgD family transcriptional regulator
VRGPAYRDARAGARLGKGLLQLLRPYLLLLLTRPNAAVGLTRRAIEVLAWVAGGKTNAETAELLSIAPGTVKKHLDHIYEKLGVGTRTEAVVTAMGVAPPTRSGVPSRLPSSRATRGRLSRNRCS